MRTLLKSAVAGTVLAALAPAAWIALTPDPRADALAAALDPLQIAQSICNRPTTGPWPSLPAAFVAAAAAYAQELPAEGGAETEPLWTGLGPSAMTITTDSAAAQIYFNQGLNLMHGFNHGEAINSFRQAQALDPECAMCFWGEALSFGPNINWSMPAEDYAPAWAAATRAVELADANGTDKERALAHALIQRYAAEAPESRSALDEAWADAIGAVADQYPDDDEIQAMAAEAIMDLAPWTYWVSDGVTPVGRALEAIERLETVIARNPQHAPSLHLYIHMTEDSADPWRAAAPADSLLTLAPAAGHLVHMPSHTYYRIGRFKDSLAANVEAVLVDEAYLAETEGSELYRFGYYPHNIHFALTSAQMAGDAETSLEMADKLDAAVPFEMATTAPWVQPIKAAPWFARAQFADPESVLAAPGVEDPTLPYLTAAWRYARGEALAKLGRAAEVNAEAAAIAALRATGDFSALGGVPAADILTIMELVLEGRAATVNGDHAAAIIAFQEAADLQAALAYTEPPYWWYPVRQSLAAALLRDGQAERAELEFYRTLIESPNNGWAYWGLAQARRALGDRRGARDAERRWRDAWAGERDGMNLERL